MTPYFLFSYLRKIFTFFLITFLCNILLFISQPIGSIVWNKKSIINQTFSENNSDINFIYKNISFKLFVRYHDSISDMIRIKHYWPDCVNIYEIWNKFNLWKFKYFIDIGANIGSCSLLMLHSNINVISFEPVKNNLHLISKSMFSNINYLSNFTLYMVGLGSITHKEKIYINRRNWGGSSLYRQTNFPEYIDMYRLDDIFFKVNGKIGMMKIDIECSELNMIDGAKKFITENNIKLIYFEQLCVCERIRNLNEIYSTLTSLGYTTLNKLNCTKERYKDIIAIKDI